MSAFATQIQVDIGRHLLLFFFLGVSAQLHLRCTLRTWRKSLALWRPGGKPLTVEVLLVLL